MIIHRQSTYSVEELVQPLREAAQRHEFGVLNMMALKAPPATPGSNLIRKQESATPGVRRRRVRTWR